MSDQTAQDQAAIIAALQEQLAALQAQAPAKPKDQNLGEQAWDVTKHQASKNLDEFCSSVAQGAGWGIALALTLF